MVDKDEVREGIVNVATNIFSRFGFKKTTMDDIAGATRKGKSSIYYYFKNKEEIFQAVVEKEASILKQELQQHHEQTDSPAQKLKMHVLTRMKTMERLSNFYSAIKDDFLSHLDFVEQIRKKYDQEEIQMMEKILIEGVEKDMFEIEDTQLAAIAIVTALKGIEAPLFHDREEKHLEHRLDSVIHILFNGIVKR